MIADGNGQLLSIKLSKADGTDGTLPSTSEWAQWEQAVNEIDLGKNVYENATLIADKIIAAKDLVSTSECAAYNN